MQRSQAFYFFVLAQWLCREPVALFLFLTSVNERQICSSFSSTSKGSGGSFLLSHALFLKATPASLCFFLFYAEPNILLPTEL